MLKKMIMLAALASAAVVGAPQEASACNAGHYEYRTTYTNQWIPARTVRYQERVWVPGRSYYTYETQVVRNGYWRYDCGRRIWCPPVTRAVRVLRNEPGCYKTVWRTRTVPGYHKRVPHRTRVFVSDCRCHLRSRHHFQPRRTVVHPRRTIVRNPRTRVVVRTDGRRIGREIRRSGRKVNKEFKRTGRRIGKEIRRIFD